MKIDPTIIDKYLDNKATSEERELANQWLSTMEGQKYMASRFDRDVSNLDTEEAIGWLDHPVPADRMKKRLLGSIQRKRDFRQWLKVAAIVIPFLLVAGGMLFFADRAGAFSEVEYATITVPNGSQMQVILQDGTSVQLNSASKLRYPKTFGLFKRKVELWGEAYFNVSKDKGRPFIVDLKGVNIKVTGTQFNVKAYPTDSSVAVLLDEGSVSLEDKMNNTYPLKPGECADYDRGTGGCIISKPTDKTVIVGWRSSALNFYRTPLREILETLERQYDVTFDVTDQSLNEVRFTFSSSKILVIDVLKELEIVSRIRFVATNQVNTYQVIKE